MFCDQCGKPIAAGTRFCVHCGKALTQDTPAKKKSGKGLLVAGLCAGFLLIVIAAVGLLLLYPRKETVYLLTSRVSYDEHGNVTGQIVFDYDSQGRLLCAQLQNEAGETHRQLRLEYDEYSNRTLVATDTSPDGTSLSLTYETAYDFSYDEDGRVETCQVSSSGSTPKQTCEFTYDEDGNLILVEWVRDAQSWSNTPWQYYEYDEDGNLTTEYFCIYYFPYGYGVLRKTYEYNSQGQLIEARIAQGNSEKEIDWKDLKKLDFETVGNSVWEYEYNKDGQLCGVNEDTLDYDKNGNPDVDGFVFDDNGNLIYEEHSNGSRTEYTYMELPLSRKDARFVQRQKNCLPAEFSQTTYFYSLDPVRIHMYVLSLKNDLFYSYMIPHPIW